MMTNEGEMRIVGLSGSLREHSYTRMALAVALRGAAMTGAVTRMIDLRDYNLPLLNPDMDEPADVVRLRADMQSARGIIIGTPEYHGSFSGVLKNALDWMGFDEFEGRIVGLLAVSAGRMGGINALNSLQVIGRSLHAWVIPEQVAIPRAKEIFDADGQIVAPGFEARLLEMGRQVARFGYLHSAPQTLEFLKAWESAPDNPGGDG